MNILSIGNSYTYCNNLPGTVVKLAENLSPSVKIHARRRAPGGCTWERHWQEGKARSKIKSIKWDKVVLQEQSSRPIEEYAKMREYGGKLVEVIRACGARPLLYMTWAYADKPEMTAQLARAYKRLGKEWKCPVAPVGLAWREALKLRPDFPLHVEDKSHPTPQGSYLAACVLLKALTGRSPRGLPTVKVTKGEAEFLQQIADQKMIELTRKL